MRSPPKRPFVALSLAPLFPADAWHTGGKVRKARRQATRGLAGRNAGSARAVRGLRAGGARAAGGRCAVCALAARAGCAGSARAKRACAGQLRAVRGATRAQGGLRGRRAGRDAGGSSCYSRVHLEVADAHETA
ncbi:unnamed protein product [Closterium sp. NIES-64]|nr:unnamed protein product [Closterium sp. NIES-64]